MDFSQVTNEELIAEVGKRDAEARYALSMFESTRKRQTPWFWTKQSLNVAILIQFFFLYLLYDASSMPAIDAVPYMLVLMAFDLALTTLVLMIGIVIAAHKRKTFIRAFEAEYPQNAPWYVVRCNVGRI